MRLRILPYMKASKSAKLLADVLRSKRLRRVNSRFKPRKGDVVVNWGSSYVGDFYPARVLNKCLSDCHNKLYSFLTFRDNGVSIPLFWTEAGEIPDDAYPVVCRTVLTGHSGKGIVIAETSDDLVDAPLYTKYIKKKEEYRIHVMAGEVFYIQRKARKLSVETLNWKVRNLEGGFVFVEAKDTAPSCVLEEAVRAVSALDMDFGGVDVIYNEKEGKAYVLEVNSACGLGQRTAEKYAAAILSHLWD